MPGHGINTYVFGIQEVVTADTWLEKTVGSGECGGSRFGISCRKTCYMNPAAWEHVRPPLFLANMEFTGQIDTADRAVLEYTLRYAGYGSVYVCRAWGVVKR